MKLLHTFFALTMLTAAAFVTVTAQRAAVSGISLIPDQSVGVLRIDWKQARGDKTLEKIIKADDFTRLAAQIGVPEKQVSEWIIFTDVNPTSSHGMGMIVSGSFSAANVSKKLDAENWEMKNISGRTVYVSPSDGTHLLTFGDGLLAFGTGAGIEKIQAALARPQKRLSGKKSFSSIYSRLDARAPIKLFVGVPQAYQKAADITFKVATTLMSFTSLRFLGMVFDKIGLIQSAGFSFMKGRESMPMQLIAAMPDKRRAQIGAGALNLLKSAPQWLSGGKTPPNAAIQSLNATSKENLISIRFSMPKSYLPQ